VKKGTPRPHAPNGMRYAGFYAGVPWYWNRLGRFFLGYVVAGGIISVVLIAFFTLRWISSIIQDPAVEFCVMLLFILGTGCGLFLAFYDEYDDL
jgi:hypothetical protein